jgi:hypothetical protein
VPFLFLIASLFGLGDCCHRRRHLIHQRQSVASFFADLRSHPEALSFIFGKKFFKMEKPGTHQLCAGYPCGNSTINPLKLQEF